MLVLRAPGNIFGLTCESGRQLLTCFAAAISLLYMWTAVRARANTTHIPKEHQSGGPVPGAEVVPYNAAASVCLAVWFFFWLWLYNTYVIATAPPFGSRSAVDNWNSFRAYRPQYFLPLIVFSIFINVTATYGTQFPSMKQAEALGNTAHLYSWTHR